jgi:protein TonB
VTAEGKIGEVNVLRGIGAGCDEAAVKAIRKTSGKWTPGRQNGRAVRVYYNMPVKFKLS